MKQNTKLFQCVCGKCFDNKSSLAHHKTKCKTYQTPRKILRIKQKQEHELKRLQNGMFRCENPDCGKEHDGSYGSGRFCCVKCKNHAKTIFANINRKLNGYVQIPWNKGKHIKGHSVSQETKEKLSESRSKLLESCKAGFQDVGWYKVKNLNGDEFTVRGHWEENVANKLTNDGILWIRNHSLKYVKDGIRKTYNPDFYLPMTNEFIEVKGYYSDKDKEKMKLVLEQNDIKIYFIDQYHY